MKKKLIVLVAMAAVLSGCGTPGNKIQINAEGPDAYRIFGFRYWDPNHRDPLKNDWSEKKPKPTTNERSNTIGFDNREEYYNRSTYRSDTPYFNPITGDTKYGVNDNTTVTHTFKPSYWHNNNYYGNVVIQPMQPMQPLQPMRPQFEGPPCRHRQKPCGRQECFGPGIRQGNLTPAEPYPYDK